MEEATYHLRQSQQRWAAGHCPLLPLEMAWLGSREGATVLQRGCQRGQRLMMLGCTVSMNSDMETTNGEDKLWV